MSETNGEGELSFIVHHFEDVTFRADGGVDMSGHVHATPDISDGEIAENMKTAIEDSAEYYGVSPDQINYMRTDDERGRRRGRVGMGYMGSRWKSSWDPDAERAAREAEQARREKADLN